MMRREFIQVLAILAFAVGAGLFAFGRHLDPPIDPAHPALVQHRVSYDGDLHRIAAIACGFGVAFMTFGGLTLAVPHVNAALRREESADVALS